MFKSTFISMYLFLFVTASSCAQTDAEDIITKTKSLVEAVEPTRLFSGVVLIARNGQPVYQKIIGYADWRDKTPIAAKTLFHIGSITKLFTDEIIRQLEKEGKISLDDPVQKYLAVFPTEIGSKITVNHLLKHTSGLGDYTQHPDAPAVEAGSFTTTDLLGLVKSEKLLFSPGTKTKYSNSGYAVLGAIIEKVTAKTYDQNLKDRILKPLAISDIVYLKEEKLQRKDKAFGALLNVDYSKRGTDIISQGSPAGGTYATLQALFTFAEAFRKKKLPSGRGIPGYGTVAGGNELFNTTITFLPNDIVVIIMANMANVADALAERVEQIARGKEPKPFDEPKSITLYRLFKQKGYDYIKANLKELAPNVFQFPYDERFLNYYGYQFLKQKEYEVALQAFQMNTELFPHYINGYDSLAEAYLGKGDAANAAKYYKQVLVMDPENQNAKKMLQTIEVNRKKPNAN
jgi:CubicO group peptidase (beta-lactamase class C family)